MSPLTEGFFIGIITVASLAVSALFLKFWRRSRDSLFLAFGAAFLIEAINRCSLIFMANPHEAVSAYYVVRLVSFLIILWGILRKNYGRS
jgi:hypothetical protein